MRIVKVRIITILITLSFCTLFAEEGRGGINFALPNVSSGLFLDWGAASDLADIARANQFAREGGTQGFQPCRGECERGWGGFAVAALGLSYIGYTVAAREYVYRDNPEDNWVGAANGFCTGFMLGALLTAWLTSAIAPESESWVGPLLVTVAGAAAGWGLASNRETINKDPIMYYGAAVPVLVPIFIITFFAIML